MDYAKCKNLQERKYKEMKSNAQKDVIKEIRFGLLPSMTWIALENNGRSINNSAEILLEVSQNYVVHCIGNKTLSESSEEICEKFTFKIGFVAPSWLKDFRNSTTVVC